MIRFSALAILFLFLTSAAPAEPDGWASQFLGWISEWFDPPVAQPKQVVEECISEELVRQLSTIPRSDTLDGAAEWPQQSLDVAGELSRWQRFLEATVLLADPRQQLPLRSGSQLRVIYQPDRRPEHLLVMSRHFGHVQDIAFTHRIAPALAAAPALPTVVVVEEDEVRGTPTTWHQALFGQPAVILLHFGDPALLGAVPPSWTVVQCPRRSKESAAGVAQALFGAQPLTGRLGVATPQFPAGRGIDLPQTRGGYRPPELQGVDRAKLETLDYEIERAIRYGATPGAQLTVLKDGQVIYERAYGQQEYGGRGRRVQGNDLYDLASVTKAAATTLAVMKLYDEGRLNLSGRVKDYLPEYAGKAIGRYRIDQLLSHHSGLQAGLPLDGYLGKETILRQPVEGALLLSATRWVTSDVPQRLRSELRRVERTRQPVYRYSDVNYVLLQYIVEAISGRSLADFMVNNFYGPMNLPHLVFRPREHYAEHQLIPTVTDGWLGRGKLRGYVHDEGAALMGGVAGHAGLFGNATDLGWLFQLLNDGGRYGEEQLLSAETVALFTAKNRFNHRALGFDRLAMRGKGVVTAGASERTFGHTGFTGTSVWVDPDNDLVFVLLTNRVCPDPANNRLRKLGTRTKTHQALYRALNTYVPLLPEAA